jgi:hypothetical protein
MIFSQAILAPTTPTAPTTAPSFLFFTARSPTQAVTTVAPTLAPIVVSKVPAPEPTLAPTVSPITPIVEPPPPPPSPPTETEEVDVLEPVSAEFPPERAPVPVAPKMSTAKKVLLGVGIATAALSVVGLVLSLRR